MRRIGVDPGARRVGLALSESDVMLAYPHKTIEHRDLKQAALLVADEIRSIGVQEVVVGLPLRTDGTEGESALLARELARLIEESCKVSVVLWDERLSTIAAERLLSQAQVFGKRRRNTVDKVAATLILQSYLDSKRDALWAEELINNAAAAENDHHRRGDVVRGKWRRKR